MTPDKDKTTAKRASETNRRIIESLIFAGAEPTSPKLISKTIGDIQTRQIETAVKELNDIYESNNLSFRIRKIAEGYQFYLLPDVSEFAARMFRKERKMRLSKAALETLAIVAYKQPVSKSQIEYIRGVASDGVLHNLLEKNLISITGRSEAAGRPLLYSATNEFLKFFGLESFKDLPKLTEIEELMREYQETAMSPGAGVKPVPGAAAGAGADDTEDRSSEGISVEEISAEGDSIEKVSEDTIESHGDKTSDAGSETTNPEKRSEPELAQITEQD